MKTRVWTALVQPGAPDEPVLIRDGFSFLAFVFTALYALATRMWFAALILVAVMGGLAMALDWARVPPGAAAAIWLVLSLYVGFEARRWRIATLEHHGWVEVAAIAAPSRIEAERRYFADYHAATARP